MLANLVVRVAIMVLTAVPGLLRIGQIDAVRAGRLRRLSGGDGQEYQGLGRFAEQRTGVRPGGSEPEDLGDRGRL